MFEGEQVIETGDQRGGLISRRSFSKFVLAAGAAALLPRAADAAAGPPELFLFKYNSSMVCTVLPGESCCSKTYGGTSFKARQITGSGFTKNGYVRIRVRNYDTDAIYFTKHANHHASSPLQGAY